VNNRYYAMHIQEAHLQAFSLGNNRRSWLIRKGYL